MSLGSRFRRLVAFARHLLLLLSLLELSLVLSLERRVVPPTFEWLLVLVGASCALFVCGRVCGCVCLCLLFCMWGLVFVCPRAFVSVFVCVFRCVVGWVCSCALFGL